MSLFLKAISADGTRVPFTVLGHGGPTLLYAYGGFGIPLLPKYNGSVIAWLERGGQYVEAIDSIPLPSFPSFN